MRRLLGGTSLALLAALSAGCASSTNSTSGGNPATTSGAHVSHVSSPAHVVRTAATRWRFVRRSPDGRALQIEYLAGGCFRQGTASVAETAEAVTLAVTLHTTAAKGSICPQDMRWQPATVHLKAPLGRRTLRHASVK
jgi:hypothetical protein